MTINITPTNHSGQFGPGLAWRLESSLPSPFPSTAVWTLTGTTVPEESPIFQWALHQTSGIVFITPGITVDWTGQNFQRDNAKEGQSISLNATVQLSGGGAADDTGSATTTWTNTVGLTPIVQANAGAGAGLTTEEHGWLNQVQQFVTNTLTFGGTVATQLGAGGLVDHPDLNLLSLCGSPIPISGTGSIDRPRPGVGVEAYGLQFTITIEPPGAGVLNGAIRNFSARALQLTAFHKDASSVQEYPVETFETHLDNGTWLWREPFPSRIVYSVTPGFAAQVIWLCLPLF